MSNSCIILCFPEEKLHNFLQIFHETPPPKVNIPDLEEEKEQVLQNDAVWSHTQCILPEFKELLKKKVQTITHEESKWKLEHYL